MRSCSDGIAVVKYQEVIDLERRLVNQVAQLRALVLRREESQPTFLAEWRAL